MGARYRVPATDMNLLDRMKKGILGMEIISIIIPMYNEEEAIYHQDGVWVFEMLRSGSS